MQSPPITNKRPSLGIVAAVYSSVLYLSRGGVIPHQVIAPAQQYSRWRDSAGGRKIHIISPFTVSCTSSRPVRLYARRPDLAFGIAQAKGSNPDFGSTFVAKS